MTAEEFDKVVHFTLSAAMYEFHSLLTLPAFGANALFSLFVIKVEVKWHSPNRRGGEPCGSPGLSERPTTGSWSECSLKDCWR